MNILFVGALVCALEADLDRAIEEGPGRPTECAIFPPAYTGRYQFVDAQAIRLGEMYSGWCRGKKGTKYTVAYNHSDTGQILIRFVFTCWDVEIEENEI